MLGDFQHQAIALVRGLQRIEDGRQITLELHVNDCADYLGDVSNLLVHG